MTASGLSKGQRRIGVILQEIPDAHEQLLVAMEGFGLDFEEGQFVAAASSREAHERNSVAVVERLFEVLVNWLHELAARSLAEGQRLGVVDKAPGNPWERLAALDAISHESASRLQRIKELRDILGHAYPPASWRTLHGGVQVLAEELDPYLADFEQWVYEEEILPSA